MASARRSNAAPGTRQTRTVAAPQPCAFSTRETGTRISFTLPLYVPHLPFDLPRLSAVLTGANRLICDMVHRLGRRLGNILLPPANVKQRARDKQQYPQEKINDPPPPSDKQPPQYTVPLLFCLCSAELRAPKVLLYTLDLHILTVAARTKHL